MRFAGSEEGESISEACRQREQAQTYKRGLSKAPADAGGGQANCASLNCGRNNLEICRKPTHDQKLSCERREGQQLAGLAALISIAAQVSMTMPEAATVIIPSVADEVIEASSPHILDLKAPQPDKGSEQSPLRKLQARLLADHLVRNSLYLMLSSGLQAALGFAFWVIVARLFSTGDVGRASSLVSAISLLAILSLFGMNTTLVRFLPTTKDRDALITSSLISVATCGAAFGLIYILLTPLIAPRLAFVDHQPGMVLGFVLLASGAAVNLLTDSVFIASRKAGYCALTDGGVSGITKIVSGFVLAGTGAYGLFSACGIGFAAAALVSLVLIAKALRWRPSLTNPFRSLKPLLRFSSANYAGNIFMLLPTLVVPIIVLDRLGASTAAYYFVAYQIATLLYSAVYAVEGAFLAEGSHDDTDWRETRRRSRRFAVAIFVPACLVLVIIAHWVMLAFGARYSHYGTSSLIVLALAVIPLAASNWSWTVLRLTGQLKRLAVSTCVFMLSICGLAWFLAPHGLTALSASWPLGCSLSAVVAGAAVAVKPRRVPRHRRTSRVGPYSKD